MFATDREEQLRILHKLNEAEALGPSCRPSTRAESVRPGRRRFAHPDLGRTIHHRGADENLLEVAIGMPHRGRLM